MTLYDLLKRLKARHRNLDYERSRTPWSIGLGGVRGRIPRECRQATMDEFETLIGMVCASDYAEKFIDGQLTTEGSTCPTGQLDEGPIEASIVRVETELDTVRRHGQVDSLYCLVKDEMEIASKDGSAYRILADIYREFPEFVNEHFPL